MIDLTTYALLRKQIAADAEATGDALALKLTEPSSGLEVGKYFRIAAIDEAGHAVLEAVDLPSAPVKDVKVAGTSIVTDGVASVPIASSTSAGVAKINQNYGISIYKDTFTVQPIENNHIDARSGGNRPVTAGTIDYAVKAAMCDGKGAAWTEAEQAAARERIGLPGEWELIEECDISEEINMFSRDTESDGTPYKFSAMVAYADFANVSADTVYESSTYIVRYSDYNAYDYFTARKINPGCSLRSWIDCTGKCLNS